MPLIGERRQYRYVYECDFCGKRYETAVREERNSAQRRRAVCQTCQARPDSTEALDGLCFASLRRANTDRCGRYYHPLDSWSLQDWLMAVVGELGELANVLKHARRGQNTGPIKTDGVLDSAALAEEAADVVIYLDLLCARAGVDLGAAVRSKFNKVSRERLNADIFL